MASQKPVCPIGKDERLRANGHSVTFGDFFPHVHATTRRIVNEAFAAEEPHLKQLPFALFRVVLRLERRISGEGMVIVGGNFNSVPNTTRR